jgi:hypothetical protein
MKTATRGYGCPRTLRSKVDRIKARTPQGALLELTRLTQEKMRLREEVARWERRLVEIRERLQDISAMETFLYRFIEPAGNTLLPTPDSAVPKTQELESTAPDVHEVTVRY